MRPITDLLRDAEGGELVDELTHHVDEIVRAVLDTRKKGTLTIKLEFSPSKRMVEMAATFDAKVPQHDRPATGFFVLPDGSLSRRDPDQPDLPLRAADTGAERDTLRRA